MSLNTLPNKTVNHYNKGSHHFTFPYIMIWLLKSSHISHLAFICRAL